MSQPRGFGLNGKSLYSNVAKPSEINLSFVVDSANANGLGISSLKSNGYVQSVFMHTSQTPAGGNPNPAVGYAMIQLNNNFNYFLSGLHGLVSQNSGSAIKIDNSAMTAGQAYVITTLGNASLAKWQAIGVPQGVVPAVGVAFIALSNGGAGNTLTSRVQVPSASGIVSMEIVGDPNQSISNSNIAQNGGAYLLVQFLKASTSAVTSALTMNSYTPAGTNDGSTPPIFSGTPAVLTGSIVNSGGATSLAAGAPADGSVVKMKLYFDGSSVTVDGI